MGQVLPPRFWAKVDKSDDECWLWTGAHNGIGYANTYRHSNQRFCRQCHRLSDERRRERRSA